MRDLNTLNHFRVRSDEVRRRFNSVGDDTCVVFRIPSPVDHQPMMALASSDGGWEHVSVSRRTRTPNWTEMEHIKRLFFRDTETAMQLHVPLREHVNYHSYCLHLWRPTTQEIPRPPAWMVGPLSTKVELDEPEVKEGSPYGKESKFDAGDRSRPSDKDT